MAKVRLNHSGGKASQKNLSNRRESMRAAKMRMCRNTEPKVIPIKFKHLGKLLVAHLQPFLMCFEGCRLEESSIHLDLELSHSFEALRANFCERVVVAQISQRVFRARLSGRACW